VACFDDGRGWCGFGGEAAWLGRRSSDDTVASQDGRTAATMLPSCIGGTEQRKRLNLDGVSGTRYGRRGTEAVAQRARTGDLGVDSDRAGSDRGARTADNVVGAIF
jgi:hypothetical protein